MASHGSSSNGISRRWSRFAQIYRNNAGGHHLASAARRGRGRRTGLEQLEPRQLLTARPVISEFMASNAIALDDDDGQSSDWVELYNAGTTAAQLDGWYLTDDAQDLTKWQLPDVELGANQYLVVYASNKDRAAPGGPLHANFQLNSDGEYLALVEPDGATVAFDFGPQFPRQNTDQSYGLVQATSDMALVTSGADARALVPTDGSLGTTWTQVGFVDADWVGGTTGLGYERTFGFDDLIGLDVEQQMYNVRATAYLRIPFSVADVDRFSSLVLRMKYDDGFVAYLNGGEIARRNAPEVPDWDSAAMQSHADGQAVVFEEIDVAAHLDLLRPGNNVLAIHGLNAGSSGSDFLILPELVASENGELDPAARHYFRFATPGRSNGEGTPVNIAQIDHEPAEPTVDEDLIIRATVDTATTSSDAVTLHYRAMFGRRETTVAMLDDGVAADLVAGDGIYSSVIPAGAASAGQMLRWYVTAEVAGLQDARWPLFIDPVASPEYDGTVIADAGIETGLPVLHWFVESTAAAETDAGTRASVYYNGEFHDNVFVRIRGGTARAWPKKSYKVEFNDGYHFRFLAEMPRVDEFNLNATYTDKSYVRAVLTSELQQDAGTPSPESYHVRVQQNGQFYSVAIMVEQPDRDFLRRNGLDDDGALYKGGPGSRYDGSTGSFEKKTRRDEDKSDLQSLIDGLKLQGEALENFLFDNVDLPAQINFMATNAITQNIDASDKNHYVYRDTEGSGEWQMTPWDLDLTFGPDALNTDTIVADQNTAGAVYPTAVHPFLGARQFVLHAGKYNDLLDRIVTNPRTQDMLRRRIRTLTDEFLGTSYFQNRIDELVELIAQDVLLDKARWGGSAHFSGSTYTLQEAVDRIKDEYLARRVPYLTEYHGTRGVGIPAAQQDNPTIEFDAARIDFNPASGNQDEEYIPLVNPNRNSVDISGWRLTGGVQHTFRPGTVLPAGGTLYVTPDVRAFRARQAGPSGGQGLFVQGNYAGHISNFGETINLLAADGTLVASVTTPAAPSDVQQFLRVTELHYDPAGSDDTEFIELQNISDTIALDLSGVRFTDGFSSDFHFTDSGVETLAPGQFVLVVKNAAAFEAAYVGLSSRVAGQYEGSLNNAGETIKLEDADGSTVLDFDYLDDWYSVAGGLGPSLVIVDSLGAPDSWSTREAWRASTLVAGSPGAVDPDPLSGDTNFDGAVNVDDLNNVRNHFGADAVGVFADANGDGAVNVDDLNLVRNNFGRTIDPVAQPGAHSGGTAGSGALSTGNESGAGVSVILTHVQQHKLAGRAIAFNRIVQSARGHWAPPDNDKLAWDAALAELVW